MSFIRVRPKRTGVSLLPALWVLSTLNASSGHTFEKSPRQAWRPTRQKEAATLFQPLPRPASNCHTGPSPSRHHMREKEKESVSASFDLHGGRCSPCPTRRGSKWLCGWCYGVFDAVLDVVENARNTRWFVVAFLATSWLPNGLFWSCDCCCLQG